MTSLLLVVLMAAVLVISSSSVPSVVATSQDVIVATQEMQKANYFTFVLLLNMAPNPTFEDNITFLMPNDRALSEINMAETTVLDFLLRHSIPSPLLIDHLEHFPTGSTVPTSKPGFILKVTNDGRRHFFLGNVRITSPNICTQGSSIRCHGIDGVLVQPQPQPQPSVPPCPRPPVAVAPLPSPPPPHDGAAPAGTPSPPPPPPLDGGGAPQPPAAIPAPSPSVVELRPPTSSSTRIGHAVGVDLVIAAFYVVWCQYCSNLYISS